MPARTTAATATSSSRPPADPAAAPGGWDTWSRRLQNLGRWGVFAIPVYALFAGLTQRDEDAYSTDPAIYAHYRRHVRFAPWELIVTYGLGLLCVVSLVALTAL